MTDIFEGTLDETLTDVAQRFNLNAENLIGYANQDCIGGHHSDPSKQGWPGAKGIWGVEGQIIYALIRETMPECILEIGNRWGTSSRHICAAARANRVGKVLSLDIEDHEMIIDNDCRHLIFESLFDFDYAIDPPIDFLFEDSNHSTDMVSHVWRQFKEHAAPGAIIVSHDAAHFRLGELVRRGADMVVPPSDYRVYLTEPSLCGLAIWRKP